ncbi:MAG: hypothetical protein HY360_18775 [Verrucomicrobia bacterium]|nr:hypothetical protein [Verrucomicrobiota bacterium]
MTTVVIPDTKGLAELVQPSQLAEQGFTAPRRVSVIFGVDHTGEEAYHVYLVFPDQTPDSALAWNNVKDMVRWVQERIWKADGEQRWPYVRIKRESEIAGEPGESQLRRDRLVASPTVIQSHAQVNRHKNPGRSARPPSEPS